MITKLLETDQTIVFQDLLGELDLPDNRVYIITNIGGNMFYQFGAQPADSAQGHRLR